MCPTERPPTYRFGAFEFDGDSYELTRGGVPVALAPQPARVLALLLSDPGRVVTREEFRAHLWGDQVNVDFGHGLNSCLSQLRATLGETAEEPIFVQTVPRRGYRFIGPVEVVVRELPVRVTNGAPDWMGRVARFRSAAVVAVVMAVLTVALGYRYGGSHADPASSVDGLTDETAPDRGYASPRTGSPGHEIYLTARALYERGTQHHLSAAIPAFEEALEIDPGLGPAWAGLALALAESELPAAEKRERVAKAATRALEIDPALGDAHVALGLVAVHQDHDLTEARAHFQRAVQHAPGEPKTHQGLAAVLAALGEPRKAVAEAEKALRLDPLSVGARADAASVYYLARRYDEAIAAARQVVEIEPSIERAWNALLFAAVAGNRQVDAKEAARHRLVALGAVSEVLRRFDRSPYEEAMQLWWAWHVEWVRSELSPAMQPMAVPALIQLGEYDRALGLLEQATRDGDAYMLPYLVLAPYADPLRGEPRFQALERRIARR